MAASAPRPMGAIRCAVEWTANWPVYEPVRHDEKGSVRHAIHFEVKSAAFVADAETEAAIVSPHEVNRLVGLTVEVKLAVLAGVRRLVLYSSCKQTKSKTKLIDKAIQTGHCSAEQSITRGKADNLPRFALGGLRDIFGASTTKQRENKIK